MWQIKQGQVSFRVTEESDINAINDFALQLQNERAIIFENGRDFTKALILKCQQLESDLKTAENELISVENDLKTVFRSELKAAENEVKQLREQLAAVNNLPAPEPEVKEVPTPVADNQLLITLTENPSRKRALLREISKRRADKYGNAPETPEELAEKMIFNDGTVFNLGGEFYTGF